MYRDMEQLIVGCILWMTTLLNVLYPQLLPVALGQEHIGKTLDSQDLNSNKFRDPDFVRNKEHVKEHLDGQVDVEEKDMTDEELEFHYFKLHDFDNNTKLDGLEIMAAISHVIPFDPPAKDMTIQQIADARTEYFAGIIDQVMLDDDFNQDGYLTYLEYVLSRRRHQEKEERDNAHFS